MDINYDGAGNPLGWTNGRSLSWQNGRQLAYVGNPNAEIYYQYNDNGERTSKTVNGTTTNYYLNGSQITRQDDGSNLLDYFYDERGNLVGFEYAGGTGDDGTYYYTRNSQGDIIGILDSTGTKVVTYTYDSWGKALTQTGTKASTIGNINPFRYRGYYYDTETKFYYLNSRYYDPEVCRFLNADGILGANGDMTAYNMYAYCSNNSVNLSDPSGLTPIPVEETGEWLYNMETCGGAFSYTGNDQRILDYMRSIGLTTTATSQANTDAEVSQAEYNRFLANGGDKFDSLDRAWREISAMPADESYNQSYPFIDTIKQATNYMATDEKGFGRVVRKTFINGSAGAIGGASGGLAIGLIFGPETLGMSIPAAVGVGAVSVGVCTAVYTLITDTYAVLGGK